MTWTTPTARVLRWIAFLPLTGSALWLLEIGPLNIWTIAAGWTMRPTLAGLMLALLMIGVGLSLLGVWLNLSVQIPILACRHLAPSPRPAAVLLGCVWAALAGRTILWHPGAGSHWALVTYHIAAAALVLVGVLIAYHTDPDQP